MPYCHSPAHRLGSCAATPISDRSETWRRSNSQLRKSDYPNSSRRRRASAQSVVARFCGRAAWRCRPVRLGARRTRAPPAATRARGHCRTCPSTAGSAASTRGTPAARRSQPTPLASPVPWLTNRMLSGYDAGHATYDAFKNSFELRRHKMCSTLPPTLTQMFTWLNVSKSGYYFKIKTLFKFVVWRGWAVRACRTRRSVNAGTRVWPGRDDRRDLAGAGQAAGLGVHLIPPVRRRWPGTLTAAEREEISRGLAQGVSWRAIACYLGATAIDDQTRSGPQPR